LQIQSVAKTVKYRDDFTPATSHTLMKPTFNRRTFLQLLLGATALAVLPACTSPQGMATLTIIPRSEWGAAVPAIEDSVEGVYDPVTNPGGYHTYETPLTHILTTIVVHHSALPLSDGVLEIQEKHMRDKRYADIGYHYAIDVAGTLYEGRPLNVRGAHTGGHNTGTVGIVLLGNFEESDPTRVQLDSLNALSRGLVNDYGITHLAGHRDFQPEETVCPGRVLAAMLTDLARNLPLIFGTEGYVPP
jgi:hypothetical protein